MEHLFDDPFDGKTRAECWYADIIKLPHHVSKKHAPMSQQNRAAQFSSFAALSGFKEALAERGRYTESMKKLDEDELMLLDRTLQYLLLHKGEALEVAVKHFVADAKKKGGSYVTDIGHFIGVDSYKKMLLIEHDECTLNIPLQFIAEINQLT